MPKKSTTKVSKIKNSKINKDEFRNNKEQVQEKEIINEVQQEQKINEENLAQNQTNEQEVVMEQEELKNQETEQTQNIKNEEQVESKNNDSQSALIEKLLKQISEINSINNSLKDENEKLKKVLDDERKQLIVKLEEKANIANKMIEEKKHQLEQEKIQELANLKDAIYVDIVSNFLEPIMLFEQTLKNSPNNPVIQSYVQGYGMIANMFNDKLNTLGIEEIDVNVGDEFNEAFMEAFDVEEVEGLAPNKVTRIISKGYVYKGMKVVKFTTVIVSK